ncbi:methyl-accepting chemotaxis protein [uncultured Deefgea sp.]|uniref:methyl-accepting chemotaxis protein n=1 Tax=uncultured Deefgea sp. TaxID=1304914 RepID=UPI0035B6634E
MNNMTLRKCMVLGLSVIVLVFIALACVTYSASVKTIVKTDELKNQYLPHLIHGQELMNEVNGVARHLRNMQIIGTATPEDKLKADAEWEQVLKSKAIINKIFSESEENAKINNDQEAIKYLAKVQEKRANFLAAQVKFKALFDTGDAASSRIFVMGELRETFNVYRDEILAFISIQQKTVLDDASLLSSTSESTKLLVLISVVLGVIFVLGVGFFLLRKIKNQLGGDLEIVQQLVDKIASGDLNSDILVANHDTSSLMAKLQQLQVKLRAAEVARIENARVKTALDSVSTSVMIADADRNIIYCNRAVERLLQNAESDIKKDLPQFSARNIIGANIDGFHKNPAHQRGMLDRLAGEHRTSIVVGGRTFALIVNPVVNEKGGREGYVVEWLDRTEALAAELREQQLSNESARILGALEGTSANVMLADVNRVIVYMNKSVISMLSGVQNDLRKVLPSFDVAKLIGTNIDTFHKNPSHQSSLLANLTSTYISQITVAGKTFKLVASPVFAKDGITRLGSVVEWIDRTQEVAVEVEVGNLVDAAVNGDFTRRVDPAGKEGFMLKLAEGMNQLVESNEAGLTDVARVLGALAQGDLTQKITAEYRGLLGQLKEDCNTTSERLAEIVANIKEAASTINVASQEIAAGNSNLSSRTEQQAASLEETASSMEELTSTVKQNAENARQANQLAIGASDIAVKGGDVVGQVVSTMADINDSAKKIVDIISVIDGIAFQTNILALNAAVEAARAGEQGRGFAVVASEVRNLAQRSAGAAKEIKTLIGDSVLKVEAGSKLVDQAGHTMQDVVGAVRRVTDIMSEISAASSEQSAGIEQVNQAITHMDENTQQNAALVEEAAAAAESLEEQAGNLTQTVAIFKLGAEQATHRPVAVRSTKVVHSAPSAAIAKPSSKAPPRSAPSKLGGDDAHWEEF